MTEKGTRMRKSKSKIIILKFQLGPPFNWSLKNDLMSKTYFANWHFLIHKLKIHGVLERNEQKRGKVHNTNRNSRKDLPVV